MVCPLSSRGFIVKLVTEIVIKYRAISQSNKNKGTQQAVGLSSNPSDFVFFSQKMANMKVLKDYLCMIKITLYKIDLL